MGASLLQWRLGEARHLLWAERCPRTTTTRAPTATPLGARRRLMPRYSHRFRLAIWAAAAAGTIVFLLVVVLTGFPWTASAILSALVFLAVFIGSLTSPYFGRGEVDGVPCPACGGLGYRIAAHPFFVQRGRCLRCGGRGRVREVEDRAS
jgi:hypothetical protein